MNTLTLEKHCWAEIDLTALRENYEYIRRTVGGPVCAVVKADAYGHGDNVIARVLQEAGAAGFAVSSLGEGRHLRRGGGPGSAAKQPADPGTFSTRRQSNSQSRC